MWEKVKLTSRKPSEVMRHPAVLRRFVYLILLMTEFNWMSHGTQDIYPTFLKAGLHFSSNTALSVAIIYNIGALIGGSIVGRRASTSDVAEPSCSPQRWGCRSSRCSPTPTSSG